ncbi:MAG: hypothetical protein H7A44_12170 [Opitutaceae bacterium]|nr:hypothetical protein [Opitutaceae bacterium]
MDLPVPRPPAIITLSVRRVIASQSGEVWKISGELSEVMIKTPQLLIDEMDSEVFSQPVGIPLEYWAVL